MRLTIVLFDSFLLVVRALFAVVWAEMISRTAGPLTLRFLLQPLMVSAFALCGGNRGAGSSRMPFLGVIGKEPVARISRWVRQQQRDKERSVR